MNLPLLQEKLKLLPPEFQTSPYLAAGAFSLLFLFWVVFILPAFSLFDLKKNPTLFKNKKIAWCVFIILFWGLGGWVYQLLNGVSKFRKFSAFYGLLAFTALVYNFELVKPYLFTPPKPTLHQIISAFEKQENPRLTLAHRIDWASDLKILEAELDRTSSSEIEKKQIRLSFLRLFETFKEKNKLTDDTFSEWKNVFNQRESLDSKTLDSLIHAFNNLQTDSPNASSVLEAKDRKPIDGPKIPLSIKIGQEYPSSQAMTVPLEDPVKLDEKTKAQILDLRIRALKAFTQFLNPGYQPRSEVFGGIVDGKPWPGEAGLSFYGPGPNISNGNSEQSKSIVNPFALFWPTLFPRVLANSKLWRPSITQKDITGSEFPLGMKAIQLIWAPHDRRGILKLATTNYLNKLRPLIKVPVEQIPLGLSLDSINSRDFGLDYIIWNETESKNIHYDQSFFPLFRTKQFYQANSECGLSQGCNGLGLHEKELDAFTIRSLPATLTLDLWNEDHIKNLSPDFKFIIEFE